MKKIASLLLLLLSLSAFSQADQKLLTAMKEFNSDEQTTHALVSLYVINAKTGEVVFDQNSRVGMATASTEKIITAATAFDVLGSGKRFETKIGIVNTNNGKSLYIEPSGDPSFGSWRWDSTKEQVILSGIKAAILKTGIKNFESVIINNNGHTGETIPNAWMWEDLGQYYGAPSYALNWRENQFDLLLKSGANIGDAVTIVKSNPYLHNYKIVSEATAAAKDAGDNSYFYYPSAGQRYGLLRGSIPAGQNNFTVSGSIYDPMNQFVKTIAYELKDAVKFDKEEVVLTQKSYATIHWIYTHQSPPLSSLVYWFLRKSINLYGEALLKSVGTGSTDAGITAIQKHWESRGVDNEELHLYDGSGLSPQNRITTHAQVTILKYAQQQPWFKDYYEAFPLYNEIKMKSGTINRVKGFCGYHQSKDGTDYIFSMLVNNYNGRELSLVRKIYKVLDNLK